MKVRRTGIEKYLQDESNSKSVNIDRVCLPENAADLSVFLRGNREPFTVYGGGTGIAGGATADGGIIISTEKLGKTVLDAGTMTMTLGAGALLSAVHETASKSGLWYPVDSTEQTATIGGNAATNAWGTRSYKYGSVRDFIEGIQVVLQSGEILDLQRGDSRARGFLFKFGPGSFRVRDLSRFSGVKNSAGYFMKKNMDLIDLFIGSEGTLGVITEVTIRLKKLPEDIYAFMIPFGESREAFDFMEKIKSSRLINKPLSIEYMDSNAVLLLADKYPGIGRAGSLAFVEVEEGPGAVEEFGSLISSSGIDAGEVRISSTRKKKSFVYEVREALPQLINEKMRQKGLLKVSTDFSVEDKKSGAMITAYERAMRVTKVKSIMFGHAGNNNLHINFLPADKKEREEALDVYDSLAREIAGMGGTISSEHGIGKMKKKYLGYMYSESEINAMKKIKKFFDPLCRCCPGNIFDMTGSA
jgi:D-lactate dehydrogenase (cytochrome)